MRGDHAGTEGKVRGVNVKHEIVTVDGVSEVKADGKEVPQADTRVQPAYHQVELR